MLCGFVNCVKTVFSALATAQWFTKKPQLLNFPIAKDGTKTIEHLSIGCVIRI
jgi:hypothetical protein